MNDERARRQILVEHWGWLLGHGLAAAFGLGLAVAGAELVWPVLTPFLVTRHPGHGVTHRSRALAALKQLWRAQTDFRRRDADRDGVADFGTLAELRRAGLVDETLGRGRVSAHAVSLRVSSSLPCDRWIAVARPLTDPSEPTLVITHVGFLYWTNTPVVELADDARLPADCWPVGT